MTTSPVTSITEEQLINLDCCDEYSLRHMHGDVGLLIDSYRALQERLRAAEKDASRLEWLDRQVEAYGTEGIHEGNRWLIDGPYRDLRQAIDEAMEAQP